MTLSEVFRWQRTGAALQSLEALLRCSGCGALPAEPHRYGRCAHLFCARCAAASDTCAACAVPSEAHERRVDTTLRAVAAGCDELRQLLGLTAEAGPQAEDRPGPPPGAGQIAGGGEQAEDGGGPARPEKDQTETDEQGALNGPATAAKGKKKNAAKASKSKRNAEKASIAPAEEPASSVKPLAPAAAAGGGASRRTQSSGGSSSLSAAGLAKRNAKGETRLHAACVQGNMERVRALLAAGASPNTQDNAGWTPLHEACEAGRTELAGLLLEAGALPDPPGLQLRTPLHEAVAAGRPELAALLVSRGADPDARCLYGSTPRQLAAGRPELLAALQTPRQAAPAPTPAEEPAGAVVLATAELPTASVSALKKTAARLGWRLATGVTAATTHLVCSERPAGLSVPRLRALLAGAWLVTPAWSAACAEAGRTLPAEPWHVAGEAGSRACLRRRLLQPPLLAGLHVYLQGGFRQPARAELASLIQLAGGHLLSRPPNPEAIPEAERTVPYHAVAGSPLRETSHLVVFEEPPAIQYDMCHVKSLPLAWLLLSLETHTLADPIR